MKGGSIAERGNVCVCVCMCVWRERVCVRARERESERARELVRGICRKRFTYGTPPPFPRKEGGRAGGRENGSHTGSTPTCVFLLLQSIFFFFEIIPLICIQLPTAHTHLLLVPLEVPSQRPHLPSPPTPTFTPVCRMNTRSHLPLAPQRGTCHPHQPGRLRFPTPTFTHAHAPIHPRVDNGVAPINPCGRRGVRNCNSPSPLPTPAGPAPVSGPARPA